MNIKNNYHFGCVITFVIVSVALSFYLGKDIKEKEEKERQELLNDTAKVNAAYRTYERVHRQLLMEDPDYSELYYKNEELRERLKRIKDYAEEAENDLFIFEENGYDVSEIEDNLNNILDECE